MNTRCGALGADRLPIAGKAVSWRVRPCESRAVVPVLVWTMRLPSASVWIISLVLFASEKTLSGRGDGSYVSRSNDRSEILADFLRVVRELARKGFKIQRKVK